MGLLQKIFDRSATLVNSSHDECGDEPIVDHTRAALRITVMGMACEAAVIAGKATGRKVDTSKAGFGGYTF